jgi:hypothetical protein
MKDIQIWASILEAGRLVSISVRGAGPCVRLPLPRVRGTTDPRIPLWGPLHPKVQHISSRAYALPERHGFVLFGGGGRARWVPPGNLPALEGDFAALAAEAEALSQLAARRWGRIRQWVALAAARKAEEAGLAPDWRARWEEALEEAFQKGPPRLELRMLQARVSDPVQVTLEARRLRAAAAEAEALEAREEAARALARDLLAFGREVRDQVWRETRQLLRELGQGLAQTLEKGGARPPWPGGGRRRRPASPPSGKRSRRWGLGFRSWPGRTPTPAWWRRSGAPWTASSRRSERPRPGRR